MKLFTFTPKSIALLLLSCLMFSSFPANAKRDFERGMNPGMALRLEQKTIDAFKRSMQDFFPHYVVADMSLPTDEMYHFSWLFGYVQWTVQWTYITYDVPKFDIQDIQFKLTDELGVPEIVVDFPAIKEWKIRAVQSTDSIWLPDQSKVEMCFKDFDVDFSASLHVNEDGNLKPKFYRLHIDFGDSYLTHDNWFFAFTFHQFVKFAIIVIENTAFFCGELMFSNIGEPILTTFLNDYRMPLHDMPTPFYGQGKVTDNFELDWRNTIDPVVKEGQLDMYFLGEITYGDESCGTLDPDQFDFTTTHIMGAEVMSQLVVSESALACLLNSVAKSKIGQLDFNEQRLNEFFQVTNIKTDTTSMEKHFPLFNEKIGPNKALKVMASVSHIEVKLGQFDADITLDYTLHFSIHHANHGSRELMYDEVRFITAANLGTSNDDVYVRVQKHEMNLDSKFGGRSLPIRNNMKMTTNEYREFLTHLGSSAEIMKNWLNSDIFHVGVKFPYRPDEFITEVRFDDKSMHIMFAIKEDMTSFLEKKLW